MGRRGRDGEEEGENWRRRKGERKSWGVLQMESTVTRKKKMFCVLITKTMSVCFRIKKLQFLTEAFPCFT